MLSADTPVPAHLRRALDEIDAARLAARIQGVRVDFAPALKHLKAAVEASVAARQVAVCPKCQQWFTDTESRNEHKRSHKK